VTEESGVENLFSEGTSQDSIYYVGHVMIDNLLHQVKKLEEKGGRTPRWSSPTAAACRRRRRPSAFPA